LLTYGDASRSRLVHASSVVFVFVVIVVVVVVVVTG